MSQRPVGPAPQHAPPPQPTAPAQPALRFDIPRILWALLCVVILALVWLLNAPKVDHWDAPDWSDRVTAAEERYERNVGSSDTAGDWYIQDLLAIQVDQGQYEAQATKRNGMMLFAIGGFLIGDVILQRRSRRSLG